MCYELFFCFNCQTQDYTQKITKIQGISEKILINSEEIMKQKGITVGIYINKIKKKNTDLPICPGV